MRKLITILASMFLLSTPTFAKEYKVGDLMPDYTENMLAHRKGKLVYRDCFNWVYNYFEKNSDEEKVVRFLVAFSYWNKHPFLVYDFKSNIAYFDYENSIGEMGADGRIDSIQDINKNNKLLPIEKYNPTCGLKSC